MSEVELPDVKELEEEKGKRFTKYVALVTAIFAVLLAITSLGGNNAAKEMLLTQQQSADQWAFYQSKAMREHLYRSQKMRLEADLFDRPATMKPAAQKKYEALLNSFREAEVRENAEKKKIEADAKRLEEERDRNMSKDPYFDHAEVLLQIAIVMASISILASSRQVFAFAIVCATAGTILMLNGYLLIFRIPFFH
ncbi:MAG TPA: DUF4337 domain-containing protein [Dissulfurispiraceae bacterium]|nr:DUF4337 domain-containing protein [Dissulfurispiraceae bacterium]